MKNRLFSPIVITILLAIIIVSAVVFLRPQEEKVIKKVAQKNSKLQKIINRNQQAQFDKNSPSLLTQERIYTEEEIKNTTPLQFEEMLKETEAKLPLKAELKQIPEGALHHTPTTILEAGRNLGALKEVLKFHPEYEEKIIPLYHKCAQASDRPTTVRALCLTDLITLSKKRNTPIDLTKYPNDIVSLTKIVTDM